jgi:hypothetical protein
MLSYQDHIPEPQQLCDRIGLKKLDVRQALTALTFMQLLQKKKMSPGVAARSPFPLRVVPRRQKAAAVSLRLDTEPR